MKTLCCKDLKKFETFQSFYCIKKCFCKNEWFLLLPKCNIPSQSRAAAATCCSLTKNPQNIWFSWIDSNTAPFFCNFACQSQAFQVPHFTWIQAKMGPTHCPVANERWPGGKIHIYGLKSFCKGIPLRNLCLYSSWDVKRFHLRPSIMSLHFALISCCKRLPIV